MPRGGPPPTKKGNSTSPTLADYASPYASIADPNLQKPNDDDDEYFEPHKYTNDGNLIPSPPLTPPPRERRSSSATSIKTHCSGDSVSSNDTTYTVISAHLQNVVFTHQSRGGAPPKKKREILPGVPPVPSTLPTAPLLPRTPIMPPSASPSNSPVLSAHSVSPPMSPTPTNSRSTPTRSGRLPTDLTMDGSAPNGNKDALSEGSPVRPRMPPSSMSEPDMYSPNARRAANTAPIQLPNEDWQRMCLYTSDYDF